MAQAKKKRNSKHRGNAAGIVEMREPSWRSAATRSLVAVVIFVAVLTLLLKVPANETLPVAALMLLFYVPLSYYTDRWLYRRRIVKDAAARKGKR